MNDLWFYFYILEYWDEISEQTDEDCGFVQAKSFSEAALKISKCYGEDNINKLKIKIVEDGDSEILTLNMFKSTLKEVVYGKD